MPPIDLGAWWWVIGIGTLAGLITLLVLRLFIALGAFLLGVLMLVTGYALGQINIAQIFLDGFAKNIPPAAKEKIEPTLEHLAQVALSDGTKATLFFLLGLVVFVSILVGNLRYKKLKGPRERRGRRQPTGRPGGLPPFRDF